MNRRRLLRALAVAGTLLAGAGTLVPSATAASGAVPQAVPATLPDTAAPAVAPAVLPAMALAALPAAAPAALPAAAPAALPAAAPAALPAAAPAALPDAGIPAAVAAVVPAQVAISAQVVEQARFAAFTLGSPQALDNSGIEPSLYRGRFYRASMEPKRLCIVRRESEGHYFSVNHTGKYRGAYQVSPELARGATWMMLAEHEQLLGPERAKEILGHLRTTPFNKWSRYWQDALFSTVMNWKYTGSGAHHWAGGRWTC